MAETKISVRSDLLKIAEDLKTISQTAADTARSLEEATKGVGKEVDNQVAVVSSGMDKLRKFGKSVASQLGSDFKALFSVNALAGGMKLSEQFGTSIKQAVNLNDTIRNLAPIFGMNEAASDKFKRTLVKNLSAIGVGSDAAANALQGLAETNVRGETNLSEYAKTASQLAGISRQKGQEGNIAKGMANVVVAQGGNPNDPKAMQKVAEDIVRIRNATGKSATEALDTLNKLFSSANTDFKKKLLQGGGVSLAAAGLIGGQGSTAFLERYMGMSKQGRAGIEAQGLGRLIGANGNLDSKAFQRTTDEAKRRGGGNAEFGLQTMGMSEEEAKGFLRLADAMKTNGDAVERARTSQVNLNDEYRKTISLGDAFKANLNKVKGGFTALMDTLGAPNLLNKLTNGLQDASQSGAGSAAVVGGSAILAAMLTGGGLKGIGKGLLQSKAIEGVTGEKSQNVFVTNWPSSFGIGGSGGMAAGAGSALAGGGALATAAAASTALIAAGAAVSIYKGFTQTGDERKEELKGMGAVQDDRGNYISNMMSREDAAALKNNPPKEQTQEEIAASIDRLVEVMSSKGGHGPKDVNVTVKTKDKSLMAFPSGSRGTSQ